MPVASVGDTATETLAVTRDAIDEFAALTGDRNPLHVDEEYAAEGPLDGPVAHGLFAASAVSAALADLPGDIVYVTQDLEFTAPVRPGADVEASVEVVEAVGGDRLRVETRARTDDATVLRGEAVVLSVPHDPEETEGTEERVAG